MSYLEVQRKKAIELRNELFKDSGGGLYENEPRKFVLKDQTLNIWEGVREDATAYFQQNSISFWESINKPSGHLLSSQISCINHLFFMRQRQDLVSAVLRGVDSEVKKAVKIEKDENDIGFVVFEENGQNNYLHERSRIRGGHSTSIDAAMLGEMKDGTRKLFIIKWFYTECFGFCSKSTDDKGTFNISTYKPFLEDSASPIRTSDLGRLSIEPYFQLMRQTLLAHEMVKANEYGASDYTFLFVVPTGNHDILGLNIISGLMPGSKLTETWTNLLKAPEKYVIVDPESFVRPTTQCLDTQEIISYLRKRYWS